MSSVYLDTSIEFLKGVGPLRAELLRKELGIHTFEDLVHHFPFRYVDRTRFYSIREASTELPYIQLKGKLKSLVVRGEKRRKHLAGRFEDETGTIELKWFKGLKWISNSLKLNTEYILFGRPSEYNGIINIIHPELDLLTESAQQSSIALQPIYNTTEKLKLKGIDSRAISRMQKNLLGGMPTNLPETLSTEVIADLNLSGRLEALSGIHFPASLQHQKHAEYRLKFEELFFLQLRLLYSKQSRTEKSKGHHFGVVGESFNEFYHRHLPFALTAAQKKVLREIRKDMGSGIQMNRLLQGDVGSGKTLVALMAMLIAIDNGCQACLMAPTEILAFQHAETIASFLSNMKTRVGLLTGSTKAKARGDLLRRLDKGEIDILIGTHALIEEDVKFQNLGLAVIDEQHRFGVAQRARLHGKGNLLPHVLVMTATPIPRTLAMTLYGDLDVSVIDELPPGRKPVKTIHRFEADRLRLWSFLKQEISLGRQVYIVYPLIEESSKIDLNNLMQGYESICRDFPKPHYQVSIVHGKMKASEKDFEMQRFLKNETQIMVATTVIEVGVNVPNASVMVIENSERFGLSQLHQLRGRVGRGADQSYCILVTNYKLSEESKLRIKTMCETNDGFKIAETDLRLRGPGDAEGTRQSGMLDLKLSDISRDHQLVVLSRDTAIHILQADPKLKATAHLPIQKKLSAIFKNKGEWGRIG